jgi:predicted Na+-dependent transporter
LLFFPFLSSLSIPINFIYLVSSTCGAVGFYLSFVTLILQLAGANSALALAMTVISNLLGILIVSLE